MPLSWGTAPICRGWRSTREASGGEGSRVSPSWGTAPTPGAGAPSGRQWRGGEQGVPVLGHSPHPWGWSSTREASRHELSEGDER